MDKIAKGNDNLLLSGRVTITLRDEYGKIKERSVDNLVVTVGKAHVADQLSGQVQAAMSHMAIGTGATAQVAGDTALETELNRIAFVSVTQGTGADANKVIYVGEWPSGTGTGVLTEAGIFNAASSGTMLARTTFGAKDKGAGDSLTITWTLTVN